MPATRNRKLAYHLDSHNNICAGIEGKAPVWGMFKDPSPSDLNKLFVYVDESIEDLNSEIIWTLTET